MIFETWRSTVASSVIFTTRSEAKLWTEPYAATKYRFFVGQNRNITAARCVAI